MRLKITFLFLSYNLLQKVKQNKIIESDSDSNDTIVYDYPIEKKEIVDERSDVSVDESLNESEDDVDDGHIFEIVNGIKVRKVDIRLKFPMPLPTFSKSIQPFLKNSILKNCVKICYSRF